LAFLIVIGILLSDHFRGTMEPPPATLDRAAANVREGVVAPGADIPAQPVTIVPGEINQTSPVPTPRDIQPQQSPVVLGGNQVQSNTQTSGTPIPQSDPLQQVARQNGEDIVPANAALTAETAPRGYVAVAGDSVSRMAAKMLGVNNSKNRKLIIAANPSLQADPNMVVVGQTYVIPGATGLAVQAAAQSSAVATGGQWTYKVKPGDTLWGIATGLLNNAGAIEAIKELNRDVLHGGSTIHPGMKLRLPSAPVAVAD
jgi:nucleoid-associated protein YgaU